MVLNLWNDDSIFEVLHNTYGVSDLDVRNVLDSTSDEIYYTATFCEVTGIKLDKDYISDNIDIVGKIVSTSIDDDACLLKRGLLPIDILLETESPISVYLKEKEIEIKPTKNEILIRGKKYNIPRNIEKCDWCSLGKDVCSFEGKRFKNLYCKYLGAIESLSYKLYRDNSEIEMFIYGDRESMLGYSQVREFPEILTTINNFCKEYIGEEFGLESGWKNLKPKTNILSFMVNLNELSYKAGYISDGPDGSNLLWDLQNYCLEYYEIPEFAPKCFWENVWLIKVCILALLSSKQNGKSLLCAGIKHNVEIKDHQLLIEEV